MLNKIIFYLKRLNEEDQSPCTNEPIPGTQIFVNHQRIIQSASRAHAVT